MKGIRNAKGKIGVVLYGKEDGFPLDPSGAVARKLTDIDPKTMNIDIAKVEAAITRKTKAIVAVETFGHALEADRLISSSRVRRQSALRRAPGSSWWLAWRQALRP